MKKLNVAMIGAGSIAKTHSLGFATMPMYYWPAPAIPVRKVICDVREEAAREGAERYGWEEWSTDWREVIERPDIDLVDIITPNQTHAEIAIAAAKAGKMIYCEKPLCIDVEEGKKMCEQARLAGVPTAVGFNKRRFPAVTFAKQLIDEGYIGRPTYFHGKYFQSMAIDPDFPYHWRFAGRGIVQEAGCHTMDICRYLMGDFAKVSAVNRVFIDKRPRMIGFEVDTTKFRGDPNDMVDVAAEDFSTYFCQMKSGATATFENSNIASGSCDDCAFEVYGTRGAIKWEAKHGTELQISSADDPLGHKGFRTVEMGPEHPNGFWPFAGFGINWADLKAIEIHDLMDAFINGKSFSPNFDDAQKIVELTDAIYASAEQGGAWVELR